MRITRIALKNYKGVGEFAAGVEGHSFFILGGNNAGKTTIATAVFDLLKTKFPDAPIREGADKASITIHTDAGYTLEAELFHDEKVLRVNGVPAKVTSLRDLLGIRASFDINAFMTASPKAQVEMIEKIIPNFEDIAAEYKEAFEERRLAKQRMTTFAAQAQPYDPELADATPEPTDHLYAKINEINAKIKEINDRNMKIADAKRNKEASTLYESAADEVKKLEKRVADLNAKKIEAVNEADLPVHVRDGRLAMPDGTPVDDAAVSTSQKMLLAFEIAVKGMGALRYAHFDASILDNKTLQSLIDRADALDVQLAIERVEFEATDDTIQIIAL